MSLFSGFSTENQEVAYDKAVEYALELLSYKVIELIKQLKNCLPPQHNLWVSKFFKVTKALQRMEGHKQTEPKIHSVLVTLF
jgi:hypothetical protein